MSEESSNSEQTYLALEQFSGENQEEYYKQKNLQDWRKIENYSLFSAMHRLI